MRGPIHLKKKSGNSRQVNNYSEICLSLVLSFLANGYHRQLMIIPQAAFKNGLSRFLSEENMMFVAKV